MAEQNTVATNNFATGDKPAEVLCLFGPQGERVHVRARPAGGD